MYVFNSQGYCTVGKHVFLICRWTSCFNFPFVLGKVPRVPTAAAALSLGDGELSVNTHGCVPPSQVYDRVAGEEVLPLDRRLQRLRTHCGSIAGSIFAFIAVLDFLFLLLLQWLVPDRVMDVAVDATGPRGLWRQETSGKNKAHSKSATWQWPLHTLSSPQTTHCTFEIHDY